MANDVSNATAAFAVAMKAHEFITKKHVAEAEAATRLEKQDPKVETAQVADDSVPAGYVTEDLEEGAGDPRDAPGGTHSPRPSICHLPTNPLIPSRYALLPLRPRIFHHMRRPL